MEFRFRGFRTHIRKVLKGFASNFATKERFGKRHKLLKSNGNHHSTHTFDIFQKILVFDDLNKMILSNYSHIPCFRKSFGNLKFKSCQEKGYEGKLQGSVSMNSSMDRIEGHFVVAGFTNFS